MRYLLVAILLLVALPVPAHAETRNYVKGATVRMNADQLAASLDSALGFTGTQVTVGITPTLVVVSHPSLTSANDAAVNSAIAAYVFDPIYNVRQQARAAIAAATDSDTEVKRAMAAVLIDEINALREWVEAFKAAVAAATTLADLKTRVAALPAMPDRTLQQAVTAIQNKITSGSAD